MHVSRWTVYGLQYHDEYFHRECEQWPYDGCLAGDRVAILQVQRDRGFWVGPGTEITKRSFIVVSAKLTRETPGI